MKTWEVFKALEENPKRKFKHDRFTLSVNDRGYFYLNHDKWDCNTSAGGFNGNISKYVDWEEIKQPVPWQEAIAAKLQGKYVFYVCDGVRHELLPSNTLNYLRDAIKNGTWYIED